MAVRFATLSRAWANMCLELLSMGIAHGDLKHDNVLVTPDGKLRLIDYDSMFTPHLRGLKSVLLDARKRIDVPLPDEGGYRFHGAWQLQELTRKVA